MSTSMSTNPLRLTVRVSIGNHTERRSARAAVRGSDSGRVRPSTRSSSTLHVVRAGSSSPDAVDGGVSRAGRREAISGALAAITFGRRELEIPDKKPPRGGVLHFPGSDTLDDSSFRG